MTIQFPLLTPLGFLALLASPAVAQNTSQPAPAPSTWVVSSGATAGFLLGGGLLSPIPGKPFSAEQVTDRVQTLADGTHITQSSQKTLIYRDSEGRTRTEHIFTPPPGATMVSGPSFIQIADPIAGFRYSLNSRDHTAQRSPYAPSAMRNGHGRPSRPKFLPTCPGNRPPTTIGRRPFWLHGCCHRSSRHVLLRPSSRDVP